MEFERAVQELKGHIKDYAEEMLTKSKTRGQYECVFCGSGQGAKATGALTIYENHFYCFSCQQKGDIFDLIQQVEGIDKRQVVQHAAKRYGISIDSSNKGHELGWNDVISYEGTDRNSRKDDYTVSIGESKPPKKEQVDSGLCFVQSFLILINCTHNIFFLLLVSLWRFEGVRGNLTRKRFCQYIVRTKSLLATSVGGLFFRGIVHKLCG